MCVARYSGSLVRYRPGLSGISTGRSRFRSADYSAIRPGWTLPHLSKAVTGELTMTREDEYRREAEAAQQTSGRNRRRARCLVATRWLGLLRKCLETAEKEAFNISSSAQVTAGSVTPLILAIARANDKAGMIRRLQGRECPGYARRSRDQFERAHCLQCMYAW